MSPGYKQMEIEANQHNTDGGKTSFYDIGNSEDVDDLAEHWKLYGDEFNCLKAIVGIAKSRDGQQRHNGTTDIRDAKKLVHYANRILARLKESNVDYNQRTIHTI